MKLLRKLKIAGLVGLGLVGVGATVPFVVSCSSQSSEPPKSSNDAEIIDTDEDGIPDNEDQYPNSPNKPGELPNNEVLKQTLNTFLFDTIYISSSVFWDYDTTDLLKISTKKNIGWTPENSYPDNDVLTLILGYIVSNNFWKNYQSTTYTTMTETNVYGFFYCNVKFKSFSYPEENKLFMINDIYQIDYVRNGKQQTITFDQSKPDECPDIKIVNGAEQSLDYMIKNTKTLVNQDIANYLNTNSIPFGGKFPN